MKSIARDGDGLLNHGGESKAKIKDLRRGMVEVLEEPVDVLPVQWLEEEPC